MSDGIDSNNASFDDLPAPAERFVRMCCFSKILAAKTPGEIVSICGVDVEDIGHLHCNESEIYVDIARDKYKDVRETLREYGGVKLASEPEYEWKWWHIKVGRNAGFTIGRLRRILDECEAAPVGMIDIGNAFSLVGLRDDRWGRVQEWFKTKKINGRFIEMRPATGGESYGRDPRYIAEDEEDKLQRPPQVDSFKPGGHKRQAEDDRHDRHQR